LDNIRIKSQGFRVGRWSFPPFALRLGERIALHVPQDAIHDRDRIVAALTGAEATHGLALHESVVLATPALGPTGWRRWFRDPTAFDWLKMKTPLVEAAIQSFLNEYDIDARFPLSRLAGTPKSILGLCAAFARKPGTILYSTTGLDPQGALIVHQYVVRHLSESAAVFLAWPCFCQGKEMRDELPGAIFISVNDDTPALRSKVPTYE
jgi:hypothetical protein